MAKRRKLLPRLRRLAILLVGGVLALCLLGSGLIVLGGLRDNLGKADVALVLGNKVHPDGTPSKRLAARLDRAAALYTEGLFKTVIVSGGTGKEGFPEGDAMRAYLLAKGVPDNSILVDNKGVTTRASARNAAAIMRTADFESVMVITQYFHVPRSELAMRRAGASKVFGAHAHYFEMRDFYSIVREVPAYLKYLLWWSD